MNFKLVLLILLLNLVPAPRQVAAPPEAFAEVHRRMQAFVEDQTVAGAVTLVASADRILDVKAVGWSDIESGRRARTDDLFWIASMTKPMTAVAVLILQDEGRLSVEDAVEKHLPEFKNPWMVEHSSDGRITLIKPPRVVTLRDLLTHTSGMAEVAAPRPDCSLAELVMGYAQKPLRFAPGARWEYSNPGINTLGRIVEVVSGERFEAFLERRVLKPLGMRETTFWPSTRQARRLATPYKPAESGGKLEATPISFIKGALDDRNRTPFPAGGLFSTASDMARFYQMMLGKGAWRGRRILSESAVAELTRSQTGDLKTGFVDGMSFGLGFAVVRIPQGVTGMLSPGTFGHGGAYATQSWADPREGLIYILMIQRAGFPNGDNSPVRRAFQEAAREAATR